MRFGHQQQEQEQQHQQQPCLLLASIRLQQAATAKMDDVSAGIDDAEQMAANKMATVQCNGATAHTTYE